MVPLLNIWEIAIPPTNSCFWVVLFCRLMEFPKSLVWTRRNERSW
jgi:hypothetical protein